MHWGGDGGDKEWALVLQVAECRVMRHREARGPKITGSHVLAPNPPPSDWGLDEYLL